VNNHHNHHEQYYYRYKGTTPEPPCLEETNWRVLKDPIKVAPSQLSAMKELLVRRIDPKTCVRATAGKRTGTSGIAVNRPLQTSTPSHEMDYCECDDWRSRSAQDVAYCN
jgi:Eukaryotic-type carbonic anhydrase